MESQRHLEATCSRGRHRGQGKAKAIWLRLLSLPWGEIAFEGRRDGDCLDLIHLAYVNL